MYVLGLSFFFHNSAACLLKDGEIVAAAEEERFSRIKNDPAFPTEAVEYCLSEAGITIADVSCVAFYEKPFLKLERIVISQIENWPRGLPDFPPIIESALSKSLRVRTEIEKKLGYSGDVAFVRHHEAHAASAFYASPFEAAAVVTVDGVGEWDTATVATADASGVRLVESVTFPDSLGLFYSAFTQFLGFEVNEGEYKVMGLAPYGEPVFADRIVTEMIDLRPDGSFVLNPKYFRYAFSRTTVDTKAFSEFFTICPREPGGEITRAHMDVAASVQKVLESAMLGICRHAREITGASNLCLAGGVALNCVANSRILAESGFDDAFPFPASGDAGGAVGAALFFWHDVLGNRRKAVNGIRDTFWGPGFRDGEIAEYLTRTGIPFESLPESELAVRVAREIADQKVVGWFQGRMEFGPRALGNRSILADPRNPENWRRVNLKIKGRESFRPFAPAVLETEFARYFEFPKGSSPFMLFTARSITDSLPAATHVDGTSRVQTVSDRESRFGRLLAAFGELGGIPALVNTSFNTAGDPIVCTPQNAYQCFRRTEMDVLVLGNCLIRKPLP